MGRSEDDLTHKLMEVVKVNIAMTSELEAGAQKHKACGGVVVVWDELPPPICFSSLIHSNSFACFCVSSRPLCVCLPHPPLLA